MTSPRRPGTFTPSARRSMFRWAASGALAGAVLLAGVSEVVLDLTPGTPFMLVQLPQAPRVPPVDRLAAWKVIAYDVPERPCRFLRRKSLPR